MDALHQDNDVLDYFHVKADGVLQFFRGLDGSMFDIPTPDDVKIASVAVVGEHVLCKVADSQRLYYIKPRDTAGDMPAINPLNFFEAQELDEPVFQVKTHGCVVYLIGLETSEAWCFCGEGDHPFKRVQNGVCPIATDKGTVVHIGPQTFATCKNGVVHNISGAVQRTCHPTT